MDHRSLNFLTFNVRSLADSSRQTDLSYTLKLILVLYKNVIYEGKKVNITGYNFIHDSSSVGVAILIKESIEYSRITTSDIEFPCSFIQIDFKYNNIRSMQQ